MTRILVLTNMYPPHHYGGYELSCRDVAERWSGRGHDVQVLTTTTRMAGVDAPDAPGIPVLRQLEFYWSDHDLVTPSLSRRVRIERANQRVLARALDEVRPDVVSVWNMGAMSFGLLTALVERGVPVVHNVCGDWLEFGPRMDAWARLFLGRPRLASVTRRLTGVPTAITDLGASGTFCFISRSLLASAERASGWRFPDATVVYSGIDRRDFPPVAVEARPWQSRLLYVGRIDPRKGIDTAVRVLARLPASATLEINGRGDDRHLGDLHRLVAELGLAQQVTFADSPRAELARSYAAADVVLFLSTWEEPFGLVPVEAMACATPVVATGVGGSAEFLADGVNCLVVPPGDAAGAAAAVGRLAADASLRDRLAHAGLATAAELDVDRLAEVLGAWHVAAAERFAHGRPPHRGPPVPCQRPRERGPGPSGLSGE